jgi:hypothetical protein
MKTIPAEFVDEIWDQLQSTGEAEMSMLAQRMHEEQPFILVYLMAGEGMEAEGDEATAADEPTVPLPGRLVELGVVAWRVMAVANPALRTVTGEELVAAEAANMGALVTLDEGPESRFDEGAANLFGRYNQLPLLGALLSALMAGNEDTPELAGDDAGLNLLRLKSVIDCLDQ